MQLSWVTGFGMKFRGCAKSNNRFFCENVKGKKEVLSELSNRKGEMSERIVYISFVSSVGTGRTSIMNKLNGECLKVSGMFSFIKRALSCKADTTVPVFL